MAGLAPPDAQTAFPGAPDCAQPPTARWLRRIEAQVAQRRERNTGLVALMGSYERLLRRSWEDKKKKPEEEMQNKLQSILRRRIAM